MGFLKNVSGKVFGAKRDVVSIDDVMAAVEEPIATKEVQPTSLETDGWDNDITGLGGINAKNPGATFTAQGLLSFGVLQTLYLNDGFGRKIIDKIAKDMTREWININGDPDDTILTKLNTLKAKSKFANLVRWSKLYGGAIIIMGVNDGGDFNEPVNENRIKSIDWLNVVDRSYISLPEENFYADPTSPNFGDPEFYRIAVTSPTPAVSGMPIINKNAKNIVEIHESRILRMDGVELPETARRANNSWGDSIFTAAWKQLSNLGQTYEYLAEAVHKYILGVYHFENLRDMLQKGDDGKSKINARLRAIARCKSWFHSIALDKKEDYEDKTTPVTGLTDILDKFTLALCAAIDMPEVVLMGRTPSGLNASGDTDLESWYNTIKSEQTDNLHPILHRLVSLIIKSREMPSEVRKLQDSEWDVIFKPLEQPNRVEEAGIKKTTAETDQIYIQTSVLQPEEVAISRFGGGNYSTETTLSESRDDEGNLPPDDEPDKPEPDEPTEPPEPPTPTTEPTEPAANNPQAAKSTS
jgi:phage-related protein (TIGR01555 family)